MTYTVGFRVNGYFVTTAKGETDEERRDDLDQKATNAYFGALEDIDWDTDDADCYENKSVADKRGEAEYTLPIEARYVSKIKTVFQETNTFIRIKAIEDFEEADLGDADDCDCSIIYIEDDDGRRIYENLD